MEDVTPQELISKSTFVNIPNGNSNLDFTLAAPIILSKNLPTDKIYRIRLVNNDLNSDSAFPFELPVFTDPDLSNIDFKYKETISVYPNPAKISL